jgi:hypothetical protein
VTEQLMFIFGLVAGSEVKQRLISSRLQATAVLSTYLQFHSSDLRSHFQLINVASRDTAFLLKKNNTFIYLCF